MDMPWNLHRQGRGVLSTVGISWEWFLVGAFLVCFAFFLSIPLYYIIRYRSSIRKHVQEVERRLATGLIYREDTSLSRSKLVRALELHPPFVEKCRAEGWKVMSLGQYLSTLRIHWLPDCNDKNNDDDDTSIPKLLQKELEVTIGAALLAHLGPRFGSALLPLLGISSSREDSWIAKLAALIASFVASRILVEVSSDGDPTENDRAAFPLAVSEMVAFANLNQKFRSKPKKKVDTASTTTTGEETTTTIITTTTCTPLDWMSRGEKGYSPSYTFMIDESNVESKKSVVTSDLIPNPFVVERHFEAAILGLEDCIRKQSNVTDTIVSPNAEPSTTTAIYDPDDRSLPIPYPINERVLPGLYMGWGDAKCTHTKREILRNRLLAVLMTKLSYNYRLVEKEDRALFIVDYNGTRCQFPDEFVQALVRLVGMSQFGIILLLSHIRFSNGS